MFVVLRARGVRIYMRMCAHECIHVCFAYVFKHLRVLPSVHFNLLMTPTYIPAGPGQEKPSAQQ